MKNSIIIGQQKKKMTKWIVICLISIVAIVVAVATIINIIPKSTDIINIINNDKLTLSGQKMDEFKTYLVNHLEEQHYIDEESGLIDVMVRDGTVSSFIEKLDSGEVMTTTSFLIDIDSIKQTFRVKIYDYTGMLTDIPVIISCPVANETRYSESECNGVYGSTNKSLSLYLPLELKNSAGEEVLVKRIESTRDGKHLVQVYLYSCDQQKPRVAETEELVRKWVEDLDDPASEYYTYNIRTGYCEGDAI